MNFNLITEALYYRPSCILPSAHASIRMLLESRLAGEAKRKGTDICGDEVAVPQMAIQNGLAVIPVSGPIGAKLGLRQKGAGATDSLDVIADIEEAEANDSVNILMFDIDSPGGMVTGTPELAQRIANCKKDTVSFISGTGASAAFWIACAATRVYATPSAMVGSIGVYLPILDESQRFAAMGVTVELVKSGEFKGAGYPGTSLTDAQRAEIQSNVNAIYAMFRSHVQSHRILANPKDMQGQIFTAEQALQKGLIDEIATRQEVVSMLTETAAMPAYRL